MAPPILEGQTVSPAFIFTKNLIDIKSNLSQFLFLLLQFINDITTNQFAMISTVLYRLRPILNPESRIGEERVSERDDALR